MKPLQIAVVGAGHLGRIHARLIQSLENVELVAVVDPVEQARRQIEEQLAVETLSHHDQLIGRIDAAVIAVPTQLHHQVSLQLLEQGIHLLVEKPITSTLAQADRLVAAAEEQGLVLQVGHVERFNPALAAVARHLQHPKYIEATRTSGYTFRSTDIGVVLDLMIHDLDVTLSLVRSPVVDVSAIGISVLGNHEDMAQARLTFENGCVANLSASRTSFVAQRTMQVFSQRCFASIDFAAQTAKLIHPSEKILRRQIDIETLSPEEKLAISDSLFTDLLPVEGIASPKNNAILDELTDFADSIRQSRSPRVSGSQGRDVLAVAEQILAKIALHHWDGTADGAQGPLVIAGSSILQGPHFPLKLHDEPPGHRRAG